MDDKILQLATVWGRDAWLEIFHTVRRHRLRAVLTGLGVSWGVFMLVVLLGIARGIENGAARLLDDLAFNMLSLEGQRTSLAYQGLGPGRNVKLSLTDAQALQTVPGVAIVSPQKRLDPGVRVHRAERTGHFDVIGVYPSHATLHRTRFLTGRAINEFDVRETRKVAEISTRVARTLFGADAVPAGEPIFIGGVAFGVVGVYEPSKVFPSGEIRIPFTTLQRVFDPSANVAAIDVGLAADGIGEDVRRDILHYLGRSHHFDPRDEAAIQSIDTHSLFRTTQWVLAGLRWFASFIGAMTLVAGCIGVSNMMLMAVSERRREIGIRKALGATPSIILAMILSEALALTLLAGAAGLALGVAVVEIVAASGLESEFFHAPEVNLHAAVGTLATLTVAGLIAGFLPAQRAVRLEPIEALRHD